MLIEEPHRADQERGGTRRSPIGCADAWNAATVLRHDVPRVTHNRAGYLGVPGLKLISHGYREISTSQPVAGS